MRTFLSCQRGYRVVSLLHGSTSMYGRVRVELTNELFICWTHLMMWVFASRGLESPCRRNRLLGSHVHSFSSGSYCVTASGIWAHALALTCIKSWCRSVDSFPQIFSGTLSGFPRSHRHLQAGRLSSLGPLCLGGCIPVHQALLCI